MSKAKTDHIAERANKGDFSDLVLPLDYLILQELPPEGTTMSGLYPIGGTTMSIGKKLGLTSGQISSRVRLMHLMGLTLKVKTLGHAQSSRGGAGAWQRTTRADQLLKEWRGQNGD